VEECRGAAGEGDVGDGGLPRTGAKPEGSRNGGLDGMRVNDNKYVTGEQGETVW
jgi:hypothetical protein